MFNWYQSQINEFGVARATRLMSRVAWSRTRADLSNLLLGKRLECPCCGWRGHRFYDYIEVGYSIPETVCPNCDSHGRHRLLKYWLQREYHPEEKSGVALVFAPEKALEAAWNEATSLKVFRVDIEPARGVDLLANMQRMPFASNSIDIVWCHHVLEHIQDDRRAIRELQRILRPTKGELIVSVPMEAGPQTDEYGFADKTRSHHWRMYGLDFVERLAEAGLDVQTIDYSLPPARAAAHGTIPERFFLCSKPAG
jgi:SAM-dependent methyltransferase